MNQKNPLSKKQDLRVRTLINGFSALMIALFIFLAQVPFLKWVFAAAVSAIAATAIWEYGQLLKKKGLFPAVWLSVGAVVFYLFAVFFKTQSPMTHSWVANLAPEIILGLTFFIIFAYFVIVKKPPIENISTTFFGILYIGIPLGFIIKIMFFFTAGVNAETHFAGSWWIIYLIAVTKSADIGGFFIGRRFGKRKLAPKLSPNKTLEGAVGGLVISTLVSLLICYLGKKFGNVFENFSYITALCLGFIIGAFGQIGDLAESFLKRDANVKDSNSIPGVGGVFDMIDSLLFTAPLVYLFLRISYT